MDTDKNESAQSEGARTSVRLNAPLLVTNAGRSGLKPASHPHPCLFVFIRGKNKNPTADWQWGSSNLVIESEPNCHAAQQQRVRKQQIQFVIHAVRLTS
jgi:hypothetical protein